MEERCSSLYGPIILIAGATGNWLFYVQHQFEDAYWEPHAGWDYAEAAMRGASYYRLPRVLEWMTGRIGLHHVHHLDPKIPNYHLRRCHDENRRVSDGHRPDRATEPSHRVAEALGRGAGSDDRFPGVADALGANASDGPEAGGERLNAAAE